MAVSNSKRSSFSSVCNTSFKQSYRKLLFDGLVGYREANRMLCDRFYTVGELYIQYDDLRRSTTIWHRVEARFRDERRRVICRGTLGNLIEQLPDNRICLEVAGLGPLCQQM